MKLPFKPGDYISFVLDEGKQVTFKFDRSKKLPHIPLMFIVDGDFELFEKKILSRQDDPCWKGYRMYGHKQKNGKDVPNCVPEAEYKGRDVDLNKPKRSTDGKGKFHVFVKHPTTGNVIRVNFGDPNMEIKRDDPERRKNFRARHGCDKLSAAKDKHTPKWWSCQMWRSDKSVSDMLSEDEENVLIGFHGSPNIFNDFNTKDVFLAKNQEEASRYGENLYKVSFKGTPKFETPTIYVISPNSIISLEKINQGIIEDECGCSDDWLQDKHSNKEMVKRHLYNLAKQSIEIYNMLDTDCEIKPWMHSKIARCTGDLDAVYHTLEYDNDVLSEAIDEDLYISKLGNFLKTIVDFCKSKQISCHMMDSEGNKLSKFSDVALALRNTGTASIKSKDNELEVNLVLVGNNIKHTITGKHSKEFEQMNG